MARINLLPWREQLREEQRREFFTLLGLSSAAAALLIAFLHFGMSGRISEQQELNVTLQNEIIEVDKKIVEIKKLKALRDSFIARMNIIQDLQANRPQVVAVFDDFVRILPKGVHLSEIARKDNVLTIQGFSDSNTYVSQYMRNIDASKWLNRPVLSQIKTDDVNGQQISEFKLESQFRPTQTSQGVQK